MKGDNHEGYKTESVSLPSSISACVNTVIVFRHIMWADRIITNLIRSDTEACFLPRQFRMGQSFKAVGRHIAIGQPDIFQKFFLIGRKLVELSRLGLGNIVEAENLVLIVEFTANRTMDPRFKNRIADWFGTDSMAPSLSIVAELLKFFMRHRFLR